jgi:hypothetical protein
MLWNMSKDIAKEFGIEDCQWGEGILAAQEPTRRNLPALGRASDLYPTIFYHLYS